MGVSGQSYVLAALPSGKKKTDKHCTGDWVGPRAGLNMYGNLAPHRDSIPGLRSQY